MNTILTGYKKVLDKFNMFIMLLTVVSLIMLVACTALQVASRYITFFKILGMEELARFGFVWLVSLALSHCAGLANHLTIDLLSDHLHGRKKIIYNIVIDLFALVYLGVLCYFSYTKCLNVSKQSTIIFMIPMPYLYAPLVLGSFGAIMNTIYQLIDQLHLLFTNKTNEDRKEVA